MKALGRITEHDRQQLRWFASDLGHIRQCAVLMVFEKYPCSCPQGLPKVLEQRPEETK
jgi:hypothetical protein